MSVIRQEVSVTYDYTSETNPATSYIITYRYLDKKDIEVHLRDTKKGLVKLDIDVDYNFVGNAIMVVGKNFKEADYTHIVIARTTPITQEVEFAEFTSLRSKTQEDTIDKLTLIVQELRDDIDRTAKISIGHGGGVLNFPPPVSYGLIRYNAEADGLEALELIPISALEDDPAPTLRENLDANTKNLLNIAVAETGQVKLVGEVGKKATLDYDGAVDYNFNFPTKKGSTGDLLMLDTANGDEMEVEFVSTPVLLKAEAVAYKGGGSGLGAKITYDGTKDYSLALPHNENDNEAKVGDVLITSSVNGDNVHIDFTDTLSDIKVSGELAVTGSLKAEYPEFKGLVFKDSQAKLTFPTHEGSEGDILKLGNDGTSLLWSGSGAGGGTGDSSDLHTNQDYLTINKELQVDEKLLIKDGIIIGNGDTEVYKIDIPKTEPLDNTYLGRDSTGEWGWIKEFNDLTVNDLTASDLTAFNFTVRDITSSGTANFHASGTVVFKDLTVSGTVISETVDAKVANIGVENARTVKAVNIETTDIKVGKVKISTDATVDYDLKLPVVAPSPSTVLSSNRDNELEWTSSFSPKLDYARFYTRNGKEIRLVLDDIYTEAVVHVKANNTITIKKNNFGHIKENFIYPPNAGNLFSEKEYKDMVDKLKNKFRYWTSLPPFPVLLNENFTPIRYLSIYPTSISDTVKQQRLVEWQLEKGSKVGATKKYAPAIRVLDRLSPDASTNLLLPPKIVPLKGDVSGTLIPRDFLTVVATDMRTSIADRKFFLTVETDSSRRAMIRGQDMRSVDVFNIDPVQVQYQEYITIADNNKNQIIPRFSNGNIFYMKSFAYIDTFRINYDEDKLADIKVADKAGFIFTAEINKEGQFTRVYYVSIRNPDKPIHLISLPGANDGIGNNFCFHVNSSYLLVAQNGEWSLVFIHYDIPNDRISARTSTINLSFFTDFLDQGETGRDYTNGVTSISSGVDANGRFLVTQYNDPTYQAYRVNPNYINDGKRYLVPYDKTTTTDPNNLEKYKKISYIIKTTSTLEIVISTAFDDETTSWLSAKLEPTNTQRGYGGEITGSKEIQKRVGNKHYFITDHTDFDKIWVSGYASNIIYLVKSDDEWKSCYISKTELGGSLRSPREFFIKEGFVDDYEYKYTRYYE